MATTQQVPGDYDPQTGRISCPKCHRFCGKLTSEHAQHFCDRCEVEIITPQPTRAVLIQETLRFYQDAMAKASELLPLIQQLQA